MTTFTREALKELKAEGTKLEKKVINVLLDQGTTEEIESYINDILKHGCVSGMVGELIYYNDTIAFYEKYKNDIHNLLKNNFFVTGYSSPAELFGDKWDVDDPFAEDTQNQNLLAWWSFEEITYEIASRFNIV